ncbi:hypothetical protein EYF80_043561 [Liparis tanakae]|uniref:Uncharacterized protein n=1 Tax=Liparis tanakae TaxID=230148 RepID=A0A4Z2FY71_9TELE|nr:hypothetical protein EYF80_043561 [Liparis tanakae]
MDWKRFSGASRAAGMFFFKHTVLPLSLLGDATTTPRPLIRSHLADHRLENDSAERGNEAICIKNIDNFSRLSMTGPGERKEKKIPPAKDSHAVPCVLSPTDTTPSSPNKLRRNERPRKITAPLNLGKLEPLRAAKLLLLTPNSKN